MISMPHWRDVIRINAVAIHPDTAQTALASSVDHHYLQRYGSLFAASFLSGYSQAVLSSNKTIIYTPGGISDQTAALSPNDKLMVGLGEFGKQISTDVKAGFNRPPTVVVHSGVGIGVLFMQSVSDNPSEEGALAKGESISKEVITGKTISASDKIISEVEKLKSKS